MTKSQSKAVDWFADSKKAMAEKITKSLQVIADGKKWEVSAGVGQTAREGFMLGIEADGKFTAVEPDLSNIFGAPECYTDSDSPGYAGLRLFLKKAFPAYEWNRDFIAGQEKMPAEKRDGQGMSQAEFYVESAEKRVTQRAGFLYNAWAKRTGVKSENGEPKTPREFVLDVLKKLKGMQKSDKFTPQDQRTAGFYYVWLSFGQENRDKASAFLIQNAKHPEFGIAASRNTDAQKPSEVTITRPDASGTLQLSGTEVKAAPAEVAKA